MKRLMLTVFALGMYACAADPVGVGSEPPTDDETADQADHELAIASRPSLSSICGFVCNNSHGQRSCGDQRDSGQVNVGVFPLLENTTKVPDAVLRTTSGWTSTSCPNCQWQLESVTTNELFGGTKPDVAQATNDVSVFKTVSSSRSYEWAGTVVLRIFDPTDASVGTCSLSVDLSLSGPLL